jgi:hypothetical protein
MNEIEKAIEYFDGYGSPYDDIVIQALQEKAEREKHPNGWIPVSEGLPEERQYEDGEPIEYNIMLKGAVTPTTGCLNNNDIWGEMCWAKATFYKFPVPVIAWQPLPEPYKGVEK